MVLPLQPPRRNNTGMMPNWNIGIDSFLNSTQVGTRYAPSRTL